MVESSASYIRMVQHLIEKCLLFHMNKEECMEALSKHANIRPVITSTVWMELVKENRDFFEAYGRDIEERTMEMKSVQGVQNMLVETSMESANDDESYCNN